MLEDAAGISDTMFVRGSSLNMVVRIIKKYFIKVLEMILRVDDIDDIIGISHKHVYEILSQGLSMKNLCVRWNLTLSWRISKITREVLDQVHV